MSIPAAYEREIQALESRVRLEKPTDILQFCAEHFFRRLADERAQNFNTFNTFTRQSPSPEPARKSPSPSPSQIIPAAPAAMSSAATFSSPFAVNWNPTGGTSGVDSRKDMGPSSSTDLMDVIEEDENDTVTSPTAPSFSLSNTGGRRTPFGQDGSSDGPSGLRSPPNPDSYPPQYNFGRRTSVSAESLKPNADNNDNWTPPTFPKTPEQLGRLKKAIEGNFLFSHLDDEQSAQILGALVEKPIPAKGIKVITQGDAGDYFYVVEKGSFDVYVNSSGSVQPGPDGAGSRVGTIQSGGSFGELALMYNAPRAATVVSAEPQSTLWALDRVTFRRILMESTFARRRMYESFLEEVPLLASLTPYERSKIADALETQKFPAGHAIIKQGDIGTSFFLLEAGECDAFLEQDGETSKARHYKKGDFFGELALLNDKPRAASVVSATDVKVATLGKSAFARLLGPVEGIMRRTKYEGVKSGVEDVDPLHS